MQGIPDASVWRPPDIVQNYLDTAVMALVVLLVCAVPVTLGGTLFIEQPSDVYTYAGRNVTIPCINNISTTTDDLPEWNICGETYNWQELHYTNYTHENKALRFLASKEKDGYTYQCMFHSVNISSEIATLRIIRPG